MHARGRSDRASYEKDALLPSQMLDELTASASDTPERRLVVAVLLDALGHLRRPGSKGATEAERWIRDSNARYVPFSFFMVCETLGLEPEYLRRGLMCAAAPTGRRFPIRRATRSRTPRHITLDNRRRFSATATAVMVSTAVTVCA